MILVTGGAGFIGSNFFLDWFSTSGEPVLNLDLLTYAGNLENLSSLADDPRHIFVRGDIGDRALVIALLKQHQPRQGQGQARLGAEGQPEGALCDDARGRPTPKRG